MSSARVVVFDLDGTLTDSAPGIGRVLDGMRAERGLAALPGDAYRRWISLGAPSLIGAAMELSTPADAATVAEFRRRYATLRGSPDDLYPGTAEALHALSEAGMALGVCSNKPQALCEKVLVETGIGLAFRAVVGGDAVTCSKPHPDHLHTTLERMGCSGEAFIFVGDSRIDAEAARAAGACFLWATYGYADAEDLATRGRRLTTPADIVPAVLNGCA